jgi:formylglycine-generating enzyme required for sulfatase activity
MAGLARDVADLTVRRPWGRMAAAASALILGAYVAAHQFGALVWWPSSELKPLLPHEPYVDAEAPKPPENMSVAVTVAKGIAKADPALSVKPGSGEAFQDRLADGSPCPVCPEMVVAPAGTFTMGSPPSEPDRSSGEAQVPVTIARPFAVDKFAVTFDQWDACVADGACNGYRPSDMAWGGGNRPVITVSWDDAKAYAAWLSRKTGKTYRLLSEAEREYVTRAGTTTPFWWGSSITPRQANYGGTKGESRGRTVPVDSFEANPWGLFNVHGNVSEWTEDCWNDSNQGNPGNGSARTADDCKYRVVRGGSWFDDPQYLRAAYRYRATTDAQAYFIGFRLARTLSP